MGRLGHARSQRRVRQRHQCFLSNGKPVISDEISPQVEKAGSTVEIGAASARVDRAFVRFVGPGAQLGYRRATTIQRMAAIAKVSAIPKWRGERVKSTR